MPLALRLDHARLFQNPHVMRNRRLRQFHPLLDIARAQPGFLIDRASALFFEQRENPPASGIGNSVKKAINIGRNVSHDQEG